jgi:hypothetical protein
MEEEEEEREEKGGEQQVCFLLNHVQRVKEERVMTERGRKETKGE